jgi:hypothetical protein
MLYLNPPYFIIDGVSLFCDHVDPLQFYYLPMAPHLSVSKDPVSGVDAPQLQLIEYTGAAGTGGFINFDVNLGLADDALETVKQKLRREANLSDTPKLAPVSFVDGTVRLLILGAESTDPTVPAGKPAGPAPAPASAGPRFVLKIQNSSKPALYGDNQASFSVQLDQYGATVLEQALKGLMSPIAVVYSLEFVALRPAFKVRLHVDWSRVQTYIDDHYQAGVLFFSADIDKSIEKLIEDRVITIEIDTLVTDADGGKAVSDDRDRAVAEVYDMIKNTFFESSLSPPSEKGPDDWDKATGAYKTLSTMALTGGAASSASFSKKSVDLTRVDKKTLDVNISERTSVQRTIYPQGHLAGLLQALTKDGLSLDRFIVKVDLDNPWFERRRVTVVSHSNFDDDKIDSIDVDLTYNGTLKSVSLTKANPQVAVEWSSVLVDGKMARPVKYTYTVNFGAVDATQRPVQITSGELVEVGDTLGIQPSASPSPLYATTLVPIRTDNFPWDRYPSVEVACRYDDPANDIRLRASAVLTNQVPEIVWPMFMRDKNNRRFFFQLTYALVAGGTSVIPWTSTDDGKIDIKDPFPTKRSLTVVAVVDWTATDMVLVHVAYPDKVNPIVQKNFIFNGKNTDPQTLTADRQETGQNAFYFEAKIIGHNGKVSMIPGSVTTEDLLLVQPGMRGQQIVHIRPEQVDFASARVTEVDVELRYLDPKNQISSSALVKLTAPTDVQSFPYEYVDAKISPEYRADITLDNGQTKSLDWSPISDNAVTIALSGLT